MMNNAFDAEIVTCVYMFTNCSNHTLGEGGDDTTSDCSQNYLTVPVA
jgi:hypothetical protein